MLLSCEASWDADDSRADGGKVASLNYAKKKKILQFGKKCFIRLSVDRNNSGDEFGTLSNLRVTRRAAVVDDDYSFVRG